MTQAINKLKETKLCKKLIQPVSMYSWLAVLFVTAMVIIFRLLLKFNDSDLFYIIATGRYIINNGIPYENPFITTSGQTIVIQNWLYCVVIAFIYDKFHIMGLLSVQAISIAGMIAVMLDFLDFKKTRNKLLSVAFSVITLTVFAYINLRPEMLTFILIMLEINGLEKYAKTGKMRYLCLLPLAMLLEINCHASYWIMHIIVIIPYIMPSFKFMKAADVRIKGKKTATLVLFTVLSLGVMFINPYGADNILYVFNALRSGAIDEFNISEQFVIAFNDYLVYIFIASVVIFSILWLNKKLTSTEIYMYLGFSVLFCAAYKWVSFYAIAFLFLSRAVCRELESRDKYYIHKLQVPVIITGLMILAISGLFIFTCTKCKTAYALHQMMRNDRYINIPMFIGYDEIADYLDENDPDATVYATFHNANYFEYCGYKVFYDARPEIYAKEIAGSNVVLDQAAILCNSKDYDEWSETLNNLNVDYIVTDSSETRLYFYLCSNPDKYESVATGEDYILYKKLV